MIIFFKIICITFVLFLVSWVTHQAMKPTQIWEVLDMKESKLKFLNGLGNVATLLFIAFVLELVICCIWGLFTL